MRTKINQIENFEKLITKLRIIGLACIIFLNEKEKNPKCWAKRGELDLLGRARSGGLGH